VRATSGTHLHLPAEVRDLVDLRLDELLDDVAVVDVEGDERRHDFALELREVHAHELHAARVTFIAVGKETVTA
jgi:hypothetical protein